MPQSSAEQISYRKNPSLVVSSVLESKAQVMASQGEGECCPQQLWLPITPFVHLLEVITTVPPSSLSMFVHLLLSVRSQELPRSTSPHAEGKKSYKGAVKKKFMPLKYKIDSNLTWCHGRPAKTPTRIRPKVICSKVDTRDVCVGSYDRWQEVVGLRGIN